MTNIIDATAALSRRRFCSCLVGGAAAVMRPQGLLALLSLASPQLAIRRELRTVLEAFEKVGPYGPAPDMFKQMFLMGDMADLGLKAGSVGVDIDENRQWDLMDMARTDRYFDDPAFARRVHAWFRALYLGEDEPT